MSVDMLSSAKDMVSHFTERLEQMNHQGRPRRLRHSVSCPKRTRPRVCNVKSVFAPVC